MRTWLIYWLEALAAIAVYAARDADRAAIQRQAEVIHRLAERTIHEQNDLEDIRRRSALVLQALK